MGDDVDLWGRGEDSAGEIAELRAALQRQYEALRAERQRAQRWEQEAILRASTVAGALAIRVLAAQRLAAVVERNLDKLQGWPGSTFAEVQDALQFFREVAPDEPTV